MFIEACSASLFELFPDQENWQGKYINELEGKVVDSDKLIGNFIALTDQAFRNFNLILLSGEYISNKNFLDELNSFETNLNLLYLDYNGSEDKLHILGKDINEQVIKPLRLVLERFRHLYINSENKVKGLRKNSLLYRENLSNTTGEILNIDITSHLSLLEYNFELCYIDRNLRMSREVYERLIFIITDLSEDYKTNIFQKPLTEKASFLLKKLDYRLKDVDLSYEINFVEVAPHETSHIFKDWHKTIDEHYEEVGRSSYKFKTGIEELYSQILKKNFIQYHKLIKHYKDDDTRDEDDIKYSRISTLTEDFEKKYKSLLKGGKSLLEKFNSRAYLISLNYYYNNLISLGIRKNVIPEEDLYSLFRKIVNFQHENNLQNYFHYQKMAEYLSLKLEEEFNKSVKDFKEIKDLIDKLDKYIQDGVKNFHWCANRDYLIHQLPFEECTVTYKLENGFTFDMFIYSSFILPLNFSVRTSEFSNLKEDLKKFKLLLGFHKNIEGEMTIIEKNRRSIENSEKKNIEILSIFSAIVLFSFGEIQMFQRLEGKEIFKFSLLFAYSLIMFVLVIWLITRDYSVSGKLKLPTMHYVLIGLIGLATIVIFYNIF